MEQEATCYFCNHLHRKKGSQFYRLEPFTNMCLKKHEPKRWFDTCCQYYARNSDVIDVKIEKGKIIIEISDDF